MVWRDARTERRSRSCRCGCGWHHGHGSPGVRDRTTAGEASTITHPRRDRYGSASGLYPQGEVKRSDVSYREAGGTRSLADYFQISSGAASAIDVLKNQITFFQHNLATDTSFNDFHVILCRNVLIYFNKPLQDRVHELLYDSLVRLGVLGLGANETLHLTPKERRYRLLDETGRLYRRID